MPAYEAIVRRSWELTKKNKRLWVYGLVLATLAGGSGGTSSNITSILNKGDENLPEDINTDNVLGFATDSITSWVSNVPLQSWAILISAFIIFIIFITAVSW